MENLYKSRQEVVNMFNNYTKNVSKSIHEAKLEGKGLKMLTPNQMLKRLSIALAQIKAGNNSESLLMKSDKLFIICIDQKKLLKCCITT